MSLLAFVRRPEHAAKLKVLRPPPPRALGVPIIVKPRSNRASLIGTAFDYLLRFEIKRRAPHAHADQWVAKVSLRQLFERVQQSDGTWRSLIPDDQLARLAPLVVGDSPDDLGVRFWLGRDRAGEVYHDSLNIAFKVGKRAMTVIEDAQTTYDKYVEQQFVDKKDQQHLARCAIQLAKLDVIYRAGAIDPAMFDEPESDDVQELIDLLSVVPFESLLHREWLILNPTFGYSSTMIGGGDCDLLTADLLIDVKATKKDSIEVQWLDQIFGYYLLARNERMRNPGFPEIKRLGLYFARHGFLWVRPVSQWVDHPQFAEIEKWFVATAFASQHSP